MGGFTLWLVSYLEAIKGCEAYRQMGTDVYYAHLGARPFQHVWLWSPSRGRIPSPVLKVRRSGPKNMLLACANAGASKSGASTRQVTGVSRGR